MNEFIKDNGNVGTAGEIPEKPGIYFVRWGSKNEPISRLLGNDEKKIMYIGRTVKKGLKERIHDFIKAFKDITQGGMPGRHSAIYNMYYANLTEEIGLKDLEVYWVEYDDKEIVEDQEFYSLKLYTDMYGESPPLNKSAVRSKEPKNKSVESIDKPLENFLR